MVALEPVQKPAFVTDLTGHVAIVTGASVGLGKRFAECLALSGAAVAATARRKDKLDELAERIRAAGGICLPVQLDMTNAEVFPEIVDRIENELGLVNILVNNAGVTDAQYATKMPLELIDKVLDTNIRGPYVLSREVARRLIAAKRPGRIINLASMGAFSYGPTSASSLYSITKSANVRMTEVLAVEWSKFHINVNAIAPGSFSSEMMDGMIQRHGGRSPADVAPRGRMGDPVMLDSTLLYLVSPSSEYVTGAVLKVDDGQLGR